MFVTEPGKHIGPFTLQYVAGHDNIRRTVRYVQAIAVPCAGERNAESMQNPVQSRLSLTDYPGK